MIDRGIATFGLDEGRCPRWLFERMVKLSRQMIYKIVAEAGPNEFVKRVSDPVWFQSLGTVLAFDWNASGLTTILTAALKEAIRGEEKNLGIFICGGKGKTSRRTPDEIGAWSEKINFSPASAQALVYNSKMSAKVDSSLIQDDYQIYHHAFFFTQTGAWTVIQQGMNAANATARRYHWHSDKLFWKDSDFENTPQRKSAQGGSALGGKMDFVREPHTAIVGQAKNPLTMDLTALKSEQTRQISTELINQNFSTLFKDVKLLEKYAAPFSQTARLQTNEGQLTLLNLESQEFKTHPVLKEKFAASRYLEKILWQLCDQQPANYEKLLATPGVGPRTMRALALVAEVIYGAKPSYQDPARYSFAHGGKDATPYPVDRPTYDQTIDILTQSNKLKPSLNSMHYSQSKSSIGSLIENYQESLIKTVKDEQLKK